MTDEPHQPRIPRLRFPDFQDAGEWEEKTLNDIALFIKGKGIAKADIDLNGIIPCIRYGELYTVYGEVIDTVYSKTNLPLSDLVFSQEHDVLIPSSGETKLDIAKASCVLSEGVALGGDLNILRPNQNGIFLSYLLNGPYKREIAKKAQGDTVVHLYANQLKQLDITIPTLAEQQKIADCLSSLDAVITAQRAKLDALTSHKQGLMQQLFPAEGEIVPRLRFPEFQDAGEWGEKELNEIVTLITQKAGNNKYILMSITVGIGLVSQMEKFGREIAGNQFKNYYVIQKNDFAYNKSATKTYPEGFIALYNGTEAAAVPNSIFVCFRIHTPNVIPQYLDYLFITNLHGRWLRQFITVGARAHGSLNVDPKDLLTLPVPLPPDGKSVNEQQKIAECLGSLDALIAAHREKLSALLDLKQGLMQQLFPMSEEVSA